MEKSIVENMVWIESKLGMRNALCLTGLRKSVFVKSDLKKHGSKPM